MYCIDTSVIIDIFRGDENLKEQLAELMHDPVYISPIVLAELFKGAYLASRPQEALALVEEFLHSVELLPFDERACNIFGKCYAELQKKGEQTQELDLMIASVALAHNAHLVTRNIKDFIKIPGLHVLSL